VNHSSVSIGDDIPEWTMDAVDPARMKTMAAILRDPYPVHWDRAANEALGLEPRFPVLDCRTKGESTDRESGYVVARHAPSAPNRTEIPAKRLSVASRFGRLRGGEFVGLALGDLRDLRFEVSCVFDRCFGDYRLLFDGGLFAFCGDTFASHARRVRSGRPFFIGLLARLLHDVPQRRVPLFLVFRAAARAQDQQETEPDEGGNGESELHGEPRRVDKKPEPDEPAPAFGSLRRRLLSEQ